MSTEPSSLVDPYREWLGIPDGPRPPDHFTLLGLAKSETDEVRIRTAARARMKAVRPRCLKHPELGTRLLNEIAAAQVCLLDPARATQYRSLLAGGTSTAAAAALIPQASEGEIYTILWEGDDQPLTVAAVEPTVAEGNKPKPKRRREVQPAEVALPSGRLWLGLGVGAAAVLAVGALGLWFGIRGGKATPLDTGSALAVADAPPAPVATARETPPTPEATPAPPPTEVVRPRPPEENQPPPQPKEPPPHEPPRPDPMPKGPPPLPPMPPVGQAAPVQVRLLHRLPGHQGGVQAVAYSPDGSRLVSGGLDGMTSIWDAQTGQPHCVLPWGKDDGGVACLAVSADSGVVAVGTAGHVYLGQLAVGNDLLEGKLLWRQAVNAPVTDVGFLGKSTTAYFVAGDVRYVSSRKQVGLLRAREGGLDWTQVAVTANGQRLLMGGDRILALYDLRGSRQLVPLKLNPVTRIGSLALSANGQVGLTAGEDGAVSVWDLTSRTETHRLQGHPRPVSAVALSPDGRHAVTAGRDNTVRLWEVGTGQELGRLAGEAGTTCLAFSPDGRHVATGGLDGTVRLWQVEFRDGVRGDPAAALPDPGTLVGFRGRHNAVLLFTVVGKAEGPVKGGGRGTGVYADDSVLAAAAVHAGAVGNGQKGVVKVTILAGQARYYGSVQNGVRSLNAGNGLGSFRVEPVPGGAGEVGRIPAFPGPGQR